MGDKLGHLCAASQPPGPPNSAKSLQLFADTKMTFQPLTFDSITPKTLLCSKTGETDLGFSARLAQRDLPACHHLVKIRVRVRFRIRVSAFCVTPTMLVEDSSSSVP